MIGGVVWLAKTPGKPGPLDTFAQCLNDSGAKYYAAFWCHNCKNQEAMFGRSARLLPRIECSTPDGKSYLPVCQEAKIEATPTWEFASSTASSTRVKGTQSLETLSQLSNCPLPKEDNG